MVNNYFKTHKHNNYVIKRFFCDSTMYLYYIMYLTYLVLFQDLVDKGHGYDISDSFVDDSELVS